MVVNELQLALIGLGAAAVIGVWGYNKWQERKHFKLAEKVFKGQQPDVLMDDDPDATLVDVPAPAMDAPPAQPVGRVEPVFAETREELVAERIEPVIPASEAEDEAPLAPSVTTRRPAAPIEPALPPKAEPPVLTEAPAELADPGIEWVARIDCANAFATNEILAAQQSLAQHLAKPLSWAGCHDISHEWRPIGIGESGRFRRLRACLQLADRQGPVSDADLTTFEQGVQSLAQQFQAQMELPSREAIQEQAIALDDFCAGVDMQVAVHVVHAQGGEMRGSKLLGVAQASGLEWWPDGRFHNPEPDSGVSLSNLGGAAFDRDGLSGQTTAGVTFWFDVPCAANGPAAFDRLVTLARQFATALEGALVDDQRNPLGEPMIAAIRKRIAELQQAMAAHQIPAGGRRAQRLFR